jgi:hypothetical protein
MSMLKTETMVALGAITLVAVAAAYLAKKAGGAVGAVADTAAGIVTGNNAITQAARSDAYQGAGVMGTLGAATDIASGGLVSRMGEWLGGKAADILQADPLATITPANGQRSATSGGAHGDY